MSINTTNTLVEELKKELASLPKKKLNLEHIVSELEPLIINAINTKNYTHEEICELVFKKKNITIKPNTLKTYLQKTKSGKQITAKGED
ncbi:MAG: hypothetical protein KBD37_00065 [Burkholderiales bacterium]|nr:hypothetical protein [Burkholderiales bacterium]